MRLSRQLTNRGRPSASVGGRLLLGLGPLARPALHAITLCAILAPISGALPPAATPVAHHQPAASQPTTAPRGPVRFQPGVMIDWSQPAVRVDSRVVLRRGPLEFLACWAGKEHESILRFEATAVHVYVALGLIGLTPGHPPAWDETRRGYTRPAGDLLEITCEWEQDGRRCRADAFAWLRGIEYARTPLPRPWVFAGSLRLPDGSLAADRSGVGVALVDFPDSLISLSRGHPSRSAELWAAAHADAIPPLGTPVCLVFRPARPREHAVVLDFRGQTYVDGRFVSLGNLADLLMLARQLEPDRVQTISVVATLESDVRRVRRRLVELGLPADAVGLDRSSAATTRPATRPP